jgi:hypothetical protein
MLSGAVGVAACFGSGRDGADSRVPDHVTLSSFDTVLSTESTPGLTAPGPLAFAPDGTLLVLDAERGMVFARSASGQVRSFARAGEGPGELRGAMAVGMWGDTVWVLNNGNGRLELFGLDGSTRGSLSLPPAALNGPGAVRRDGQIAAATMGVRDSSLAMVYAPGGTEEVQRLGRLRAPIQEEWDVSGIMAAMRAGSAHPMFRNFAQPVFAPDGVWLLLVSDGLVQRYDSSARLVTEIRIEGPELERIRAEYQGATHQAGERTSFVMLRYFSSWLSVGDDLWVTLNTPEGEPTTLLVLGRGGITHRVMLPGIQGVMAMAADLDGRQLYLALPTHGRVVRLALPAGFP